MENLILGEDLQETMIFIKCFLTSLFCSSSSSSDLWEQSSEDILGTKERPKSFEGGHRERDSTETLGGATKHNMVCIFLWCDPSIFCWLPVKLSLNPIHILRSLLLYWPV